MPSTLLDFSPHNPLRDLDWRWKRANYLRDGERNISRRRDDSWVVRCYRFRNALDGCRKACDYHFVAGMYPGIYWAHELYANRNAPSTVLAIHSLEARLLAAQPREDIARKLNMSLEMIEAYHECFFDVQPHLEHTDYLMFKVLGDAVYRGLRERNYDLLWKLFALHGGVHVLEALITTFVDPSRPGEAASVGKFIEAQVSSKLSMKALVSAQTAEVNGFTAVGLIEKYLEQVAIEKKSDGGTAAQNSIIMNLGQVMTSLPFAPGRISSKDLGRTAVGITGHNRFDESAVELTGDELFRIGAGENLDIECRPLPPPPKLALPSPRS